MSLAACAFVAWLSFFIITKIRGDFLFIEGTSHTLLQVKDTKSNFLFTERSVALKIYLTPISGNDTLVAFENGTRFLLNAEKEKLKSYIKTRKENIVLLAMLKMKVFPSDARVQIWPSKTMAFTDVRQVTNLLSDFGFDDFDVAVALAK